MNILVTNDDGIASPGLQALVEAVSADHHVDIIAPDGERSGMSHYLTMKDEIRCRRIDGRGYVISGSPADCVILGVLGVLDYKPDVVLSGINLGANLGTDVVYSGTAAAARQAAFMGIPGIAVSLTNADPPCNFSPLVRFISQYLGELIRLWDREHFININAPNSEFEELPVVLTRLSRRHYEDRLRNRVGRDGETYYYVEGAPSNNGVVPGTDWAAVEAGYISLSPVTIHPVEHSDVADYREAGFLV